MRRITHINSLTGSKTGKFFLVALLLLSGWVIVRRTDSFTYQTRITIRPDSVLRKEMFLPETFLQAYAIPAREMEKTLLLNALRNTGIRLAVHDLSTPTPFRIVPESYSAEQKQQYRDQFAQYLHTQDPQILLMNHPQKLLLQMGYDAQSLFQNLKIIWEKDGNAGIISFSSENDLLSAFVVNDLCREIVQVDQALLQTNVQTEISVIQQQLNVLADNWTPDFDEERFAMKVDGRQYWLHPHYPRLTMFEVRENAQTQSAIKHIQNLEKQQEIRMKEASDIIAEGQHILRYLKNLQEEYPTDSYQTLANTIRLHAQRLQELSLEVNNLDQDIEAAHQEIIPFYGETNWTIIPRRNTSNDSREYQEMITSANTMAYLSYNNFSRFQQDIAHNNVRRIPNLLNFLWITLGIVICLHFGGLFKEKLLLLWAKEK
ncbi:MAG: hypothetical protein R3D00_05710 [Bacteroidia bacterium]